MSKEPEVSERIVVTGWTRTTEPDEEVAEKLAAMFGCGGAPTVPDAPDSPAPAKTPRKRAK